jgi:hypothetical protein
VLDLTKYPAASPNVFRVTALTAGYGVLAVGGFCGEIALQRIDTPEDPSFIHVTHENNGITNHLDIVTSRQGGSGGNYCSLIIFL